MIYIRTLEQEQVGTGESTLCTREASVLSLLLQVELVKQLLQHEAL